MNELVVLFHGQQFPVRKLGKISCALFARDRIDPKECGDAARVTMSLFQTLAISTRLSD